MNTATQNPIQVFIDYQGVLVLDGGLASRLESLGCALAGELWSARVLLEEPDKVRQAHLDFLDAGADCITTSSYQASVPGFEALGLSKVDAARLFRRSVRLAEEARDRFWGRSASTGRLRPLVAASIGPYGAYLADGSEYVGNYDVPDDDLYAFHRDRWHLLATTSADLLACETIPSKQEAAVLLSLLEETPSSWVWMSFTCRDGTHLGDGTRLRDAAALCDRARRVIAIGINCTSPDFVKPLMEEVRAVSEKPVVVYPNSGEHYSKEQELWLKAESSVDWGTLSAEWSELGASLIGGCCRVGCAEIADIREHIVTRTAQDGRLKSDRG